ncbi:MAG: hypothetical protein ABI679_03000 [Gemmatimonadota bacterium]
MISDAEDGFALPLMLAVLALGSILVAASFLMARLDAQSGQNTLNAIRAHEAAETGLGEIISWWDPLIYDTMTVGGQVAVPARTLGQGSYQGVVTRLSFSLFRVEAEGNFSSSPTTPAARKALASLVRLDRAVPSVHAALTVRDSLVWDSPSTINGQDTVPPGWSARCPVLDSSAAGIRLAPLTPPQLGSCSTAGCFSGNPPFLVDSVVADSTLIQLGNTTYGALAAGATRILTGTLATISPSLTGSPSACDVSDSLNWGEPLLGGSAVPCENFSPVIHAPGDVILTGGRGQGILLVDGSLTLGGGTEFTGLVVILGTLRNGSGGGSISGGVLARNVAIDNSLPSSSLLIHYSACVLPYLTRGTSQVTPLPYRSWTQQF